jgi:hypothetical protein
MPVPNDQSGLVPMMVLLPERERQAMLAGSLSLPRADARLAALHAEAMRRFDAFCFWYGAPPCTREGMRVVAERLETYGSPEALRLAGDVRSALAGG